ncbi:MAG: HAD family hydrolase [Chloroflexi bacterium]|nr:MAG: HAD family hydrolase [Chloroflexota bacterium]
MPDHARVRAVLFDLDNTLLLEDESTERALRDTCAAIAERTGADLEILAAAAREGADEVFRASSVFAYADAMGIWWGEALWGEFAGDTAGLREMRAFVPEFRRRVWGRALAAAGNAEDNLVEAAINAFRSARRQNQLVDRDAEDVVRDLGRDHRLALVTNGAPDVQREKLSHTSLASSFHVAIISAEIGVGKPDPRIFEAALTALDLSPEGAVMIGDSLARDVVGAHAAGLRAVWIDRGARENMPAPAPVPDARVESLREVRLALAALRPGGASPRGSRGSHRAAGRDGSRARASRRGDPSAR